MKKKIIYFILAVATITSVGFISNGCTAKAASNANIQQKAKTTGWVQKNGDWYYYNSNGQMEKGLKQINGKPYYFDESTGKEIIPCYYNTDWISWNGHWAYMKDGKLQKGWITVDNKKYFMNNDGLMQTGWIKDNGNWYFLSGNGAMETGWIKDNGNWYFLGRNGVMKTGIVEWKNNYYYCDASGKMKTGLTEINGKPYYFDESTGKEIIPCYYPNNWISWNGRWAYMKDNKLQKGWITVDNKKYFMNNDGLMEIGWIKDNGKWYFLGDDGAMKTGWLKNKGSWYYLDENGIMITGWYSYSDHWYYLYSNGQMAIGQVKINGAMNNFNVWGAWLGTI